MKVGVLMRSARYQELKDSGFLADRQFRGSSAAFDTEIESDIYFHHLASLKPDSEDIDCKILLHKVIATSEHLFCPP